MKPIALLFVFASLCFLPCQSQTKQTQTNAMATAATKFLKSLNSEQKGKAQFSLVDEERYNWHFIPRDRKGLALRELDAAQYTAAMDLLKSALSDKGFNKTNAIMKLENVLREVEKADEEYRNPGKYYFSIFGTPAGDSVWGWRLEGHHVSFNFSSKDNQLISGTPGFMGANPAVVLSGPQKGLEVLKDETTLGFALLHSLDAKQKEKAIIESKAPNDIITGASRKAMIKDPKGILYSELNSKQQKTFMEVLNLYIHRYKQAFADQMMKDLETGGLNKLQFAWAGAEQPGIGNGHYYRIQGPTIIIEYDNTQNNANHVHTVIRDLKNDFGGDQLLEHYKSHSHNKLAEKNR